MSDPLSEVGRVRRGGIQFTPVNPPVTRESITDLLRRMDEQNRRATELLNRTSNPQFTGLHGLGRAVDIDVRGLTPRGAWFDEIRSPQTRERDAHMLRGRDRDALALWADDLRYPTSTRPRRRSRRVDANANQRGLIRSRRRDIGRTAGDVDNNPVVLLELSTRPNRGIHRLITDLVQSRQLGVAILPQAVMEAAGIAPTSIKVLARAAKPSSPFAAPDTLLSGEITVPEAQRRRMWEDAYAITAQEAKRRFAASEFEDEDKFDDLDEDAAVKAGGSPDPIIPIIDGVPRASWREIPTRRTAYFLSGFDSNEFRPKWYFCELPPTFQPDPKASSKDLMDAAFFSLMPESVRLAEEMGYRVKRQGDMYAIPMKTPPEGLQTVAPRAFLFRSNHRADHVAYVGDEVYARGNIIHRPLDRKADHGPLRLGNKWHRIVKNTVPVAQ